MEKNVMDFIRKVVLASDVPFDIREDALNLLIKNSMPTGGNVPNVLTDTVTIKFPGSPDGQALMQFATITRWTYNRASDFLRNNQKISAIKEIRNETKMGLRESKDAVDYWDFNL